VSHPVFYATNPKGSTDERRKRQDILLAVIRASWEVGSKFWAERVMPYGGTREHLTGSPAGCGFQQTLTWYKNR
jgi:hypothetical protein